MEEIPSMINLQQLKITPRDRQALELLV